MKKHKRDGLKRAFNHGYRAAIKGQPQTQCPHNQENTRFQWISGWRQGREDQWSGYTGVAGIHRQ